MSPYAAAVGGVTVHSMVSPPPGRDGVPSTTALRLIWSPVNQVHEAIELIRSGRVDVSPLVTHRFPLAQYEEAFRVASDGSALKVELTL